VADRGSYRTRTHLSRLSCRVGRPAAHADADVNSCSSANDTAGLANLRNLSRTSLYPITGAAISAAEGACAARTVTRQLSYFGRKTTETPVGETGVSKADDRVGGHPVEIVLPSKRYGHRCCSAKRRMKIAAGCSTRKPPGQISIGGRAGSAFINKLVRRLSSLSPQSRG